MADQVIVSLICECESRCDQGCQANAITRMGNAVTGDDPLRDGPKTLVGTLGEYAVDKILDTAGQKGTGKWTGVSSLDLGVPVTLIGEAVYARCLSAMKDERVAASKILNGPKPKFDGDKTAFIEDIRQALLASKIVSYAQGFMLLREAAKENKWNLNYGGIALVWRGGCIIRSAFLGKIKEAFERVTPMRRLARPQEVADAILFFSSSRSDFVTGQVLSVSGGLTMAG